MQKLVIVESPTKAVTINSFLGSEYKVIASKGHIRDLPKSTLSVDTENGFKVKYVNLPNKNAIISKLKEEAKASDEVYLATDLDREGEAISWHLATVLGIAPENAKRIVFTEINKATFENAIQNPRPIDMGLVSSQQTRRVLDRIVGYKISPFLWKTIKSGLSAGRVQSVAARIIVEREEEINAFVPKEYWLIDALLKSGAQKLTGKFYGDEKSKIELSCEEDAMKIVNTVKNGTFTVKSIQRAKKQKSPAPPFTTSTLQQEASKKLGFLSERIMRVAQELYEGINLGEFGGTHGIITYMRTDSVRVSNEAANAAKDYIEEKYGKNYYPSKRRVFKSKAAAQDAHEAIRPANVELEPEKIKKYLTPDQYKLYKLIWTRFVASQMANATLDTLNAETVNSGYIFRINAYSIAFDGYTKLYEESTDEEDEDSKKKKLPDLKEGDVLQCEDIIPSKHFTEPPSRFSEAALIKFLEENGIGRPSTYTPIITTIIHRGYVTREKKVFHPTELGITVVNHMKKHFPDIVDYKFTASMENKLDDIESGKSTEEKVLSTFYKDFVKTLSDAETRVKKEYAEAPVEYLEETCEKCGKPMIVKRGRYGKFAACSGYPECKNTHPLEKAEKAESAAEPTDLICEECGAPIVKRKGKFGEFLACTNFPKCKYTKALQEEIEIPCPKCGKKIVKKQTKRKKVFYGCSGYPKCDFSAWDMPTGEKCPECGDALLQKATKAKTIYCMNKDCGYKK